MTTKSPRGLARAAVAALGLGAAALLPAPAAAEPVPVATPAPAAPVAPASSVSVEDRGDHVAVLIAGARTTSRPTSRGDRLVLVLDQALPPGEIKISDATVRRVEISDRPPSVRVQLRHGSESTRMSADMAEVRQLGETLEIIVPREPKELIRARRAALKGEAAAITTAATAQPAEATAEPARSPAPSAPAPAARIAASPADALVAPMPAEAAPGPADAPATGAIPAPLPGQARPSAALDLDRPSDDGGGTPIGTTLGLTALAALGVGGWLWQRRKKAVRGIASPLEILAQVPLGPRARVVWLQAGAREMLISVSDKDVRVLGQWTADSARTFEPPAAAAAPGDDIDPRSGSLPHARLRRNPSLTGLLRLRDQHASIDDGPGGASAPGLTHLPASGLPMPHGYTSPGFRPATVPGLGNGHNGPGARLATQGGTYGTARASQPPAPPAHTGAAAGADLATDDGEPDAEWARQLVAATRRGVLR